MERFARATAVAAALVLPWVCAPARAADPSPAGASVGDAGSEVVFRALSLLGVHYRFGGNTPETGLDCSGLVRLVYSDALGLPLPRRSEEISRVGPAIAPTELQPGDLVFFNTLRRAFSHVGIYIGNNQFVHAPSTGGSIRVESLGADYWSRRFDGARRLLTQDLLAAATLNPLSASAARAMQATANARGGRAPSAAAANRGPATLAAGAAPGSAAVAAWSVSTAPAWAATDGMPASYVPVPAANAAPASTPPAQAAGVPGPGDIGGEPRGAPDAPVIAATRTPAPSLAAAAPIVPASTAPAQSAGPATTRPAPRADAASRTARGADVRTLRTSAAPKAGTSSGAKSKPARQAAPARVAAAPARPDTAAAGQRVAARPSRGEVAIN